VELFNQENLFERVAQKKLTDKFEISKISRLNSISLKMFSNATEISIKNKSITFECDDKSSSPIRPHSILRQKKNRVHTYTTFNRAAAAARHSHN
jgi:hypothetical protein